MGKRYGLYFLSPCIISVGFILSLIGVASSYWIHLTTADSRRVYENIWKFCFNNPNVNDDWTCDFFKIGQSSTIDAVRSLLIISFIFYLASCVLALFAYIYDSVLYSVGAAVSTLIEALLIMIGLVVYTAKCKSNNYPLIHFDWGYDTCWGAFAVLLIGAGAFCFQAVFLKYSKRVAYIPIDAN